MCGICGIWKGPDSEALSRMIDAMHHRGPNDNGHYQDETVGIGMTRLAILDLSQEGHQPMSNPEGTVWIVYNGETYNFQSERQLLEKKGFTFRSTSDTEVILRMYEYYGDDFLIRLRGMFAIAIYDTRAGHGQERLLLARDPLGIKPLLYANSNGRLLFASEVKAMLASKLLPKAINEDAIRHLLIYGSIYQPSTILKDVKMLLPGCRMIVEGTQSRIEKYWSFRSAKREKLETYQYSELVEMTGELLQESTQLHMVSDVPLGAFLSGGVDSSLLVGLMTRAAGKRIKTFSVGYEKEGESIDESDEAGKTANFLGADHTKVVVTGNDLLRDFQKIMVGLDQPTVDGVNSYFVSKAARQSVTVAISGTGGDELFAGYPWFTQMAAWEQRLERRPIKRIAEEAVGNFLNAEMFDRFSEQRLFARVFHRRYSYGFLPRYANTYRFFEPNLAVQLLSNEMREKVYAGRSMVRDIKLYDELKDASAIDRVSALVMRRYLGNQLLRDIDTVSMIHSLEVRVPYLDIPFVEWALSLPASTKMGDVKGIEHPYQATYKQTGSKRILVDAGKRLGVLRDDIDMQPKRGFGMPFEQWLRGPLSGILDHALAESTIKQRGWFDPAQVKNVKKAFLDRQLSWVFPWVLVCAENWASEVLDNA